MFDPLNVRPEALDLDPESVGQRVAGIFTACVGEMISGQLYYRLVASLVDLFNAYDLRRVGYSFKSTYDPERLDFRLMHENRCLRVRLSTCGIDVAQEWERLTP